MRGSIVRGSLVGMRSRLPLGLRRSRVVREGKEGEGKKGMEGWYNDLNLRVYIIWVVDYILGWKS